MMQTVEGLEKEMLAVIGAEDISANLIVSVAKLIRQRNEARKARDTAAECLTRCKADWNRLKDWCIGGQGPAEMFRLMDSSKDAKTHADVFVKYVSSLWDELSKSCADRGAALKTCAELREQIQGLSEVRRELIQCLESALNNASFECVPELWTRCKQAVIKARELL